MDQNGELDEKMILSAFKVANLLYQEGNRLASRFGLTQQQWVLLAAISKGGRDGTPLSQLGRNLLVTKSNITGMVDRLARDGYVTRENDPSDRRVFRARLTPKGRAFLKAISPAQRQWAAARHGPLAPSEKTAYVELSRKYLDCLQNKGD